jgi:hypothetical protein
LLGFAPFKIECPFQKYLGAHSISRIVVSWNFSIEYSSAFNAYL